MNRKLLYIINHLDWFWTHRLPLAQGAREDGWDVVVAVTGATDDPKIPEHHFTGAELPASDRGFGPFTLLKIIRAVHRLIKEHQPDLIHVITLKYAFLAGIAARFHRNTKIVHTIAGLGYLFSGEGIKPRLLRALVSPLLKFALKSRNSKIIFQNPDDLELMIKGKFVDPEQCVVIRGSGVDTSAFEGSVTPSDQNPIVVMPTRLVHDKGVAVFIDSARILAERGIEGRFQIAGGVTKYNPLAISESEIKDMVSDSPVEWLGKVSDMPGLLASSTLVVYPSYYREGIPKVLLEAASIGRAIITTDHPGCREVVKDGENGFLVPVKDAEATADAIQKVLENPAEREKMGKKSRERAEQEFDVAIIVRETVGVYDSTVEEPGKKD